MISSLDTDPVYETLYLNCEKYPRFASTTIKNKSRHKITDEKISTKAGHGLNSPSELAAILPYLFISLNL